MQPSESRRCDRPGCTNSDQDGPTFPCRHRICETCLSESDDLFQESTRSEQADYRRPRDDWADCPVCQLVILLPRQTKLRDIPVLRRFNTLRKILEIKGPWYCAACFSKNIPAISAESRCSNCSMNFCDPCWKEHIENKDPREHHIYKKEEWVKGVDYGDVTLGRHKEKKISKCALHVDEPLLYFCKSDKSLLCKECPERTKNCDRACDVLIDINGAIDSIYYVLKDDASEVSQLLEEVKGVKETALKKIDELREQVASEVEKRRWMAEYLEPDGEDQLEQIGTHYSDIESRCVLAERKLMYTRNGKNLLIHAIEEIKRVDPEGNHHSIELLAFLQFNEDVKRLSFEEDVQKTIEYVQKTKCLYHHNCCERIQAFPQSLQTGTVQVKRSVRILDQLFTGRFGFNDQEPHLRGITVLRNNDIAVTDRNNHCVKVFRATKKAPSSPVCLPTYEYSLAWQFQGGRSKCMITPGALYVTTDRNQLAVVDNNTVFEFSTDISEERDEGSSKEGDMNSVKIAPNIEVEGTLNNAHERLSTVVNYQTHLKHAYLASSIIDDALHAGIVLPHYLAIHHISPWYYFAPKSHTEVSDISEGITLVISGTDTSVPEDSDKAVVLFIHNGDLLRRVCLPSDEAAGLAYNTSDQCVYIADTTNSRVVAFTTTGQFHKVYLDRDDGILRPVALVFDVQGRLIVAQENGTLKIFYREDEIQKGEEVPKSKPKTYNFFVPGVSSLPPESDPTRSSSFGSSL